VERIASRISTLPIPFENCIYLSEMAFKNIMISIGYKVVFSELSTTISCGFRGNFHSCIVHNLFTDLHFREQKRGGLSLSSPKF